MLKEAIFDFDGTLFDSMFTWDTAGFKRQIGGTTLCRYTKRC